MCDQASTAAAVTWLKYCRYGVKHYTINHPPPPYFHLLPRLPQNNALLLPKDRNVMDCLLIQELDSLEMLMDRVFSHFTSTYIMSSDEIQPRHVLCLFQ